MITQIAVGINKHKTPMIKYKLSSVIIVATTPPSISKAPMPPIICHTTIKTRLNLDWPIPYTVKFS